MENAGTMGMKNRRRKTDPENVLVKIVPYVEIPNLKNSFDYLTP